MYIFNIRREVMTEVSFFFAKPPTTLQHFQGLLPPSQVEGDQSLLYDFIWEAMTESFGRHLSSYNDQLKPENQYFLTCDTMVLRYRIYIWYIWFTLKILNIFI